MKKTVLKLTTLSIMAFLITQPVMAAKFKCWTNNEGVKECGSYVPPEYSQKKIETRSNSGRIIEVKERAKNKNELDEIDRLAKIKEVDDARKAKQKKKDDILLKTFSSERDINLLRDSKINVIEGIITVINSNNKALKKKLEKRQKKAANAERQGKKPPKEILEDISKIENRIKKNNKSIQAKRDKQKSIRIKFLRDMDRFKTLQNIKSNAAAARLKPAKR